MLTSTSPSSLSDSSVPLSFSHALTFHQYFPWAPQKLGGEMHRSGYSVFVAFSLTSHAKISKHSAWLCVASISSSIFSWYIYLLSVTPVINANPSVTWAQTTVGVDNGCQSLFSRSRRRIAFSLSYQNLIEILVRRQENVQILFPGDKPTDA